MWHKILIALHTLLCTGREAENNKIPRYAGGDETT